MPNIAHMAVVTLGSVLSIAFAEGIRAQTPKEVLDAVKWRNIGPANMGGRIVDIEAVEKDWRRVFLAAATGGVWKSMNGGDSWTPIFDDYPVVSVGDIALFQPNPDILWVGTGEANNRNSVSWGAGVYKTTNGGKTFQCVGLEDTHQIARVVTHPTDKDLVYVAAIGHLWGYSGRRGLFVTRDGGKSWEKLTKGLPDDGKTGATDLVMDPNDPNTLYVAFYQRLRRPWRFDSGGPNGGMFKSTDGGRSFRKLTKGLPPGDTGRIGLAIYRSNPKILMALVEAARTDDLNRPGTGLYRSEDSGESWTYTNTYNNRPFYYSQVRINPLDHQRVYVLTTRFMVSTDGGRTLRNGSADQEIHGDFHAMWLDPTEKDRYYIGEDKGPFLTQDHGEHFRMFDNIALGQYYRIGVDMQDPYLVYGGLQDNGSWAGPSFSRDTRGILNDSNWKMHWGDGMHVQIDPTNPRNVFTESENGSFRRYDPVTRRFSGSRPSLANISNFADHYPRRARTAEASGDVRRNRRARLFRFNWTSPLVMSPSDPKTIYLGGNHLFKTRDSGDSWVIISPDLTTNEPEKASPRGRGGITRDTTGAEQHCSITSVSVSTVDEAVIWVGTDDGNVQVTRNGGTSWTNVRGNVAGVPDGIWVSRVEVSHFARGRAYVTFDGHRSDDPTTWVFRTEDFGKTFQKITNGLPENAAVQVIREDLKNPNLLFVGTEFGLFASLDRGATWRRFMNGMPTVPVHDLVIHPRDNDLIAGTHGRSIFIADDITPLQQWSTDVASRAGHLFEQRRGTIWENTSRGGQRGHVWYAGQNPPTFESSGGFPRARIRNRVQISYWLNPAADVQATPEITLEIRGIGGDEKRVVKLEPKKGIHRFSWDLRFDPKPMTPQQMRTAVKSLEDAVKAGGRTARSAAQVLERYRSASTDIERARTLQLLRFVGRRARGGRGRGAAGGTAGPGSYLLTLRVGDTVSTATLQIRPDPLLGK